MRAIFLHAVALGVVVGLLVDRIGALTGHALPGGLVGVLVGGVSTVVAGRLHPVRRGK